MRRWKFLAKSGDAGRRDLALFSTAIDTMLCAPDLLGLTVKDVRKRNRVMRDTIELVTTKGWTSRPVYTVEDHDECPREVDQPSR